MKSKIQRLKSGADGRRLWPGQAGARAAWRAVKARDLHNLHILHFYFGTLYERSTKTQSCRFGGHETETALAKLAGRGGPGLLAGTTGLGAHAERTAGGIAGALWH